MADLRFARAFLVVLTGVVGGCGGSSGGSATTGGDTPPTSSSPPPVTTPSPPTPPSPPNPPSQPDPPSQPGPPPPSNTPQIAVTLSPATACVLSSSQLQITAAVANDVNDAGVTWSLNCFGTGCGSLSAMSAHSVTYTAPIAVVPPQAFAVSARSNADPTRSATIQVVSTDVSVAVSPKQVALTTSQKQVFTAAVAAGCGSSEVTWSVDGVTGGNATVGTIDTSGKYMPPASAGIHAISAVSLQDPTRSDSARAGVTDLSAIATFHYDNARTGQNTKEYVLAPETVNSGSFGKIFSCEVDGDVYAEPLYVANVPIDNGIHNVVFVATQHDSVYAFDADLHECRTYWHDNFLSTGVTPISAASAGETGNMSEVGIIGTPVIDVAHGTLFVVAATQQSGGAASQMLHALDLATGTEKDHSPAAITGIDPLIQSQRSALLLSGNTVYVSWGSHDDLGPYHGIMKGYDATSLAPVSTFNSTPDGAKGAIWMAGSGPADDGAGSIFLATGNGTFDNVNNTLPMLAPSDDLGDSVVRLSSGLTVSGFFTPYTQMNLFNFDLDLGSGGVVLLPDSAGSTAHPHLMLLGTKDASLLLLDRDNPGGYTFNGPDQIVQSLSFSGPPVNSYGFFSTPAVWSGRVFLAAGWDVLKAYSISNGALSMFPVAQSIENQGLMGATPVVSSRDTSNGIVWVLNNYASGTVNGGQSGPAILRAYDATNLALLYASDASPADACGPAVKFTVPTVANGKVYVGGQRQLTVYGLLR